MNKTETLKELEELAGKLSYEVSYESLKKTAPYVKSGSVKLEDKKMILIEKELGIDGKINVILDALQEEDFDGIFVKPYIKDIIIRKRNK